MEFLLLRTLCILNRKRKKGRKKKEILNNNRNVKAGKASDLSCEWVEAPTGQKFSLGTALPAVSFIINYYFICLVTFEYYEGSYNTV